MSLMSSILEFLFLYCWPQGSLHSYMPTSKKPKSKVGASSAVVEGSVASSMKNSTSSGVLKKNEAASSSKRPALCKPAVVPAPYSTEAVEVESFPKPIKKKKKKTTTKELEPTFSKVAPSDPPPSVRKNVQNF